MRLLLFAFFLFPLIATSQEVLVLDEKTQQPIFNVAIFNKSKSKSTLTDFDGRADLSAFLAKEPLIFRHISHEEFRTTKEQVLKKGRKVFLEPNENRLDEVVLSVSGFQQKKRTLSQKVVSIDQQEIISSNPQTAADLLKHSGQVFVQKSQLGGGSPMIRGFATNRLLITVDGVRMNTAIFRGGNVQNVISIDPLSVERTEVILGPGSVIYGSDAIGGVMNFYTLSPSLSADEEPEISGKIFARHATANNEKTGHFNFSYGKKKWALLTSVSYSDFGNLKMGSHGPEEYLREEYVIPGDGQDVIVSNDDPRLQVPTAYRQVSILQKVKFRPDHQWDVELGLLYSTTSDYPRYDRLYRKRDGEFRAARWYYGPQRWLLGNIRVEKVGDGNLYDQAKFTAAYQLFEESRNNRGLYEEILFETNEHVDAWSGNLDFEKKFGESGLYYGLEYVLNKVNSEGRETNVLTGNSVRGASRYPDGASWQSMAAYTNYQWKLNPDLALQGGVRYSHIVLDAAFDESLYNFPFSDAFLSTGALTGSAGINWQQNNVLGWRLNFSSAFRAPNIDDVGKVFDSAPGMVVVPNPNLEPEKAYSSEIASRLNLGEFVQVQLAAYYTYLDNAMVRRDFSLDGKTTIEYQGEPSRVQAIQNASKASVYGFEASGEAEISETLTLSAAVNLTEGREVQENGTTAALRHAAPLFGDVYLDWEKGKLNFTLFAVYNGALPYDDLAPSERDKPYLYALNEMGNPYAPDWYTLNFRSQYEFRENFLLTTSLENITDQRYRTYSSGIAAAGRNLIVALQFSF